MQVQTFDILSADKSKYYFSPTQEMMLQAVQQVQYNPMSQPSPLQQALAPKMEMPYMQQNNNNSHSTASQSQVQPTTEGILAPQKVRTERYVKVSLKGVASVAQKPLFLSWFLDNNGLPDTCLLLIPERHPNVIINFKTTHGWIEVETKSCTAPDYEIQFELKLHHALLNQRRYAQSHQPVVLRFFLLEKREDGMINNLGEVLLSLLLMSSKCPNRTLVAHLVNEDKSEQQQQQQQQNTKVNEYIAQQPTYSHPQQIPQQMQQSIQQSIHHPHMQMPPVYPTMTGNTQWVPHHYQKIM